MAVKKVSIRFQLMRGTTAEWETHPSFIPLDGEPVIYSDYKTVVKDNTVEYIPGLKLGNGVTAVNDLPFIDSGFNPIETNAIEIVYCETAENTPKNVEFGNIVGMLLPSENTINKIYLVPSENDTNDIFDEYITVKDSSNNYIWERLGGLDASNIVAKKLSHSLTFGSDGQYTFDGSEDVVVPTYNGSYSVL